LVKARASSYGRPLRFTRACTFFVRAVCRRRVPWAMPSRRPVSPRARTRRARPVRPAAGSRLIRVAVLALRDSTALVPIGFAELLRKAVQLADTIPTSRARPRLEVRLVACGSAPVVVGAGGIRVHCDATTRSVRRCDVVLVPSLEPDVADRLA